MVSDQTVTSGIHRAFEMQLTNKADWSGRQIVSMLANRYQCQDCPLVVGYGPHFLLEETVVRQVGMLPE